MYIRPPIPPLKNISNINGIILFIFTCSSLIYISLTFHSFSLSVNWVTMTIKRNSGVVSDCLFELVFQDYLPTIMASEFSLTILPIAEGRSGFMSFPNAKWIWTQSVNFIFYANNNWAICTPNWLLLSEENLKKKKKREEAANNNNNI